MKQEPYPVIGKILLIPVDQIQTLDDPLLLIREREIERLAAVIRANGLLHPLLVTMISQNQFCLISNVLMYQAAVSSGMTAVSCILVGPVEQDVILWQLTADKQQGSLHYLQKARLIRRLTEECHITMPKLAEVLCLSLEDITDMLKLCELSDDAQQTIIREGISQNSALFLANEPEEEQKELLDMLASHKITQERLIEEIRIRKNHYGSKGKIIVFKDTTVFTNTIDRAVSAMAEVGINSVCQKQESERQIEYHITIQKKQSEIDNNLSTG